MNNILRQINSTGESEYGGVIIMIAVGTRNAKGKLRKSVS